MNDDRRFEIRCDARPDGQLQVRSRGLSAGISQVIMRAGAEEMWQSVLIICEKNEEGSLQTKVIVCHPDWDQNLQIASIRSRIADKGRAVPILELDLTAVRV
jgi:hypothetical protein